MTFRWNRGELKHWGASFGDSGPPLATWLKLLAGIPQQETEGEGELLKESILADFVVREGAPPEKVVAGLEKILRGEFRLPVSMTFRDVARKVHVARGTYRFTPAKGGRRDRIELYAEDLSDSRFGGGGSGDFAAFLRGAGEFIGKRIVAGEIKDPPRGQISWHHNDPDGAKVPGQWEAAHDPDGVLQHLTEQTGLTFNEEWRKVRVLAVERKY
jgi:hypothetical protein